MGRAVIDWWDAVELWLTQLTFSLQVLLAVVVLLPVVWGVAVGLDRLVDALFARRREGRGAGSRSAGRSTYGGGQADQGR